MMVSSIINRRVLSRFVGLSNPEKKSKSKRDLFLLFTLFFVKREGSLHWNLSLKKMVRLATAFSNPFFRTLTFFASTFPLTACVLSSLLLDLLWGRGATIRLRKATSCLVGAPSCLGRAHYKRALCGAFCL